MLRDVREEARADGVRGAVPRRGEREERVHVDDARDGADRRRSPPRGCARTTGRSARSRAPTKTSPASVSPTHVATVVRNEPTITATATIIERPIVSAATATAVRERLPVRFARAIRASTPKSRSARPSRRDAASVTAAGASSDAPATTRKTETKPKRGRPRTGPGFAAAHARTQEDGPRERERPDPAAARGLDGAVAHRRRRLDARGLERGGESRERGRRDAEREGDARGRRGRGGATDARTARRAPSPCRPRLSARRPRGRRRGGGRARCPATPSARPSPRNAAKTARREAPRARTTPMSARRRRTEIESVL